MKGTRFGRPEIVEDITWGKLRSAYVYAPFHLGLKALNNEGYELISLEQAAHLRIQEGPKAFISREGHFVKESILHISDNRVILSKNSPILENLTESVQTHRRGELIYAKNSQITTALKNCIDLESEDVIKRRKIPTQEFGDDSRTLSMFGGNARDYGKFLKKEQIDNMFLWVLDEYWGKPFLNQAWLGGFSCFLDGLKDLKSPYCVRGVRSA